MLWRFLIRLIIGMKQSYMNLAIDSIWEDFESEYTDLKNYAEALDYVTNKLNLSEQEVAEIGLIARRAVHSQFTEKDIKKMMKKDPELYACLVALTITGTFFGLYLSDYLSNQCIWGVAI